MLSQCHGGSHTFTIRFSSFALYYVIILFHDILRDFNYISTLACTYYLLHHSRLGAPVPVDDGERERDGGQGRDPHLPHLTQRGIQGDSVTYIQGGNFTYSPTC